MNSVAIKSFGKQCKKIIENQQQNVSLNKLNQIPTAAACQMWHAM